MSKACSNVCFGSFDMNKNITKIQEKTNTEIVLDYLNKGGVIEVEGNLLCMSEDDQLCFMVEEKDEFVLYIAQITINNFINICNSLDDDKIEEIILYVSSPKGNC